MQQGAVAAAATEGSGAQPSLWEPPRGSSTHVKTVDVEFKELEFIDPSRMAPVYILFACAVASRDLLLVVYDIPSVSICRGSQRRKAAENLGLPATAFADIEAFGGHIPECNAMRSADGGAGAAAKRTRTSSGGFGGLQGGPEASPLARASLSQPLDTLIGGLAGGGAGGLVALSKGSGDAGSLGASLGGFPEVAAGAQGSAACALLSTLAATPPNLGLPHEQGLLAAFGQSALLPDTHVNASGALAGSQWPPAPAPGEAAPPYPPPANPAAAPPTLRPHASPPPAKRARADSAAGRRTSDGDRLSVLAEAAAVATERAPDAAAAPPLTEPDMAALRRAVRSAVMESPFLTHATPGLCKSPSNLSRASAMEQNFESVMRLAAAASEVNLEGLNRSSSAGQSGAQSVLAALLQGSAQLDGSGNLDASLPITSGRAVSMSAPGASVTTGAHREYNRDFSCSSASGSGHGARNAVAAAAAAAVAGEDVDRAISLSMFNSGPLRSESGATLDDIAELLRQNPDLTRLLEDVQTAALASRPAVAPPASHA